MTWTQQEVAEAAKRHLELGVAQWAPHIELFDLAVTGMVKANWVHPWRGVRAEIVRNTRIYTTGRLIVPEGVRRPFDFPEGKPASKEEAQSCCLCLLTGSVVRSLARIGHMCLSGLTHEAVGTQRRIIETLRQVEMLVDDALLSFDCFALGSATTRKERRSNSFYNESNKRGRRINDMQVPDAELTPLELELRRSSEDAALHTGPHAGITHGLFGLIHEQMLAAAPFHPLDIGMRDPGLFMWRCASQTWKLCTALRPKLSWIDAGAWERASRRIEDLSKELELLGRERHHHPSDGSTPWSYLTPTPTDVGVPPPVPSRERPPEDHQGETAQSP